MPVWEMGGVWEYSILPLAMVVGVEVGVVSVQERGGMSPETVPVVVIGLVEVHAGANGGQGLMDGLNRDLAAVIHAAGVVK